MNNMKKIASVIKNKSILMTTLVILIMCITNVKAATLDCSVTLRQKSFGDNVKTLQMLLNEQENCNLEVDGSFGQKTKACVISYQKHHNLSVDGVVGKNTCNMLNGNVKVVTNYTESSNINAVVITNEANIRSSATTSSKKLGSVKSGTIVEIVEEVGNWYKVNVNNTYGYIRNDLVSKNCIIVDISEQILYVYKDGQLTWSTNVVTGNKGKHDTPVGNYKLNPNNFRTETYLKGRNDDGTRYKSYVDYWMPFITSRGIGFHDASWRSYDQFNAYTYNGNGSHGCVNMQHEAAEKLFSTTTQTIDVVVRD